MLKQVLQQNPSKAEAKSNQSQRQTVARRVLVLGMPVETSIISSRNVSAGARAADSPSPVETRDVMMPATRQGWAA